MITAISAAGGSCVLDVHRDPDHHRSVLTLGAHDPADVLEATEAVAAAAVERIDLAGHRGVHPRFGAVDVVPFVPLVGGDPVAAGADLTVALRARWAFAVWAGDRLDIPCFLYGPERSLPEVRRGAFRSLAPDTGPSVPPPDRGACAVGARPALVAYNLWLEGADLAAARRIAARLRGPTVRALGLPVGDAVQVSCNLVDPDRCGPADVYDVVAAAAAGSGARIARTEVVGLLPQRVIDAIPPARRGALDVDGERSVAARLAGGS